MHDVLSSSCILLDGPPPLCAQYSIDEGLEFDNTKVDGGKPGADTVSRQKQGLNPDLIPYG